MSTSDAEQRSMETLSSFLKERAVPDDVITRMKNDKIDRHTVLLMDDQQLETYLPCLGDRLAVRHYFGLKTKETTQSKKQSLFEKLRRKMKLRKNEASDDETASSDTSKRAKSIKGNRNASKKTRRLQLGWIHEGKQVRTRNGGGTRNVEVAKTADKSVLLQLCKDLFFPHGKSKRWSWDDVSSDILDFQESPLSDTVTVGEVYEEVKMGIVRFYLHTEIKSSTSDQTNTNSDSETKGSSESYAGFTNADFEEQDDTEPCASTSGISSTIQFGPFSSFSDDSLDDTLPLTSFIPQETSKDVVMTATDDNEQEVIIENRETVYHEGILEESTDEHHWQESPRSPTPPPLIEGSRFTVRIHRTNLLEDMICQFKDPDIIDTEVKFLFVGESGCDQSGVSREAYCAFWAEFFIRSAEGEETRVPALNTRMQDEEWKAVGRILVKGYIDHHFFPLKLCFGFTVGLIQGETALSPERLLDSFLIYLSPTDRAVLRSAMVGNMDKETEEDFIEILDRFGCKSIPSKEDLKSKIMQIAHKEIIQKPKYALDKMAEVSRCPLLAHFPTTESLFNMYSELKPTVRKLLKLLHATPTNQDEDRCLKFLQQFIRAQDDTSLQRFLRFLTGSDIISCNRIEISFTTLEGVARRPVAHTCGPTLELPATYTSYPEFRHEITAILSNEESFKMDIV